MLDINVEIAGRRYPLFVQEDEKEEVLELASQLNQEVASLHRRFVNKLGTQDILAMLLMTYYKKLNDLEKNSGSQEISLKKIDALILKLDASLSETA